jgi:hypothetical protein
MVRSENGVRPRAARCSGDSADISRSASSSTITCLATPICGAASPTPGARRIASTMVRTRSRRPFEPISSGATGSATPRKTGCPTRTMSCFAMRLSLARKKGAIVPQMRAPLY